MRTVGSPKPNNATQGVEKKSVAIRTLEVATICCLFLFAAAAPNSIAITQGAWLLGMLFWIVRFAFYPRPVFHKSPLDYVLLGFFILTGLSAFLSYEPFVSIGKLRAASLFTIVYFVAQNVPSRRILRLLTIVLVAGCVASVLYTMGQRVVGRGVKVQSLKTESPLYIAGVRAGDTVLAVDEEKVFNPDDVLRLIAKPGSKPAAVKVYRQELLPTYKVERGKLLPGNTTLEELGIDAWSRGRDWRATGFYGHFVTYAEVLQLVIALALGLFVALPIRRSWAGVLLLLALLGFSYGLTLTVTRASWLAFFVSSGVIVLIGASRRALLIVGVLAIPIIIGGLLILQQKRNVAFIDQQDQSTTWRQTVWREGYDLLVSKPRHLLIGVGMDSIKAHWREWGMFDKGRIPIGHMHSNMLQLALERGVPALLIWLALLALYARMLMLLIRKLKPKRGAEQVTEEHGVRLGPWVDYGLVLGALGGLVGFFVSGLVHYNWGDSEVVMIVYFIMGLTIALNRLGE